MASEATATMCLIGCEHQAFLQYVLFDLEVNCVAGVKRGAAMSALIAAVCSEVSGALIAATQVSGQRLGAARLGGGCRVRQVPATTGSRWRLPGIAGIASAGRLVAEAVICLYTYQCEKKRWLHSSSVWRRCTEAKLCEGTRRPRLAWRLILQ